MAQPQLDIDILNQLFIYSEKKRLNVFVKNRAYKAIQAYMTENPMHGLYALGSYYVYFNEPQNAIAWMEKAIEDYGYQNNFLSILAIAYQQLGNTEKQIEISKKSLELNQHIEDKAENESCKIAMNNLVVMSLLYLNNTEPMQLALSFLPQEHKNVIMNKIAHFQHELNELGISLATYQKLVTIVSQVIHQHYYRGFSFNFELDSELELAELVVNFKEITPQEAFELDNEIDEIILNESLKDMAFADEVRKITTRCTLINSEQEEGEFA